jgi:hypothetical protein
MHFAGSRRLKRGRKRLSDSRKISRMLKVLFIVTYSQRMLLASVISLITWEYSAVGGLEKPLNRDLMMFFVVDFSD